MSVCAVNLESKKSIDIRRITEETNERVTLLRIHPVDLQDTLRNIIKTLSDLSWINKFDEEYMRVAFESRAKQTANIITGKLLDASEDTITSDAGEYVVSELARSTIVEQLNYLDIPLAELYKQKTSGNPGFDFHTQNECEIVIFGEAKYVSGRNAYGKGLKSVVEFIVEEKDIKDIPDLHNFFAPSALNNAVKGEKGYAIAFSAKGTSTETLIQSIRTNHHYKSLLKYSEVILVAVDI